MAGSRRALRDFDDSFVAILLPAYLLAPGFTPLAIGILATASPAGSACLATGTGVLAARCGYRRLLEAAPVLMIVSESPDDPYFSPCPSILPLPSN